MSHFKPRPLDEWKQTGTVFLWRYLGNTRNCPGWHCAFDEPGLRSFVDLLGLFLAAPAGSPLARTVQVAPPAERILAVANQRPSRFRSPARLRIEVLATPDGWSLAESGDLLVLSLGRERLRELAAWLRSGDEAFDTSLGPDPQQLWFWGIAGGG